MACLLFDCSPDNQFQPILEWVLLILSALFIILHGPKILAYKLCFLTRICRRNPLKPGAKDYAIITGASDGIGLEYAKQLAAKGYNLLLISRTMSKLEAVRNDLLDKHSIDVQIMSSDFTAIDIYDPIRERVKLLSGRVAVLVNNVGMMNTYPTEFADITNPDYNTRLLIINTLSVVKMCEIVLPIMKEQRFGVVINVSSGMGTMPTPFFALYSATKDFVTHFTKSLWAEYACYGITFQDVSPGQVETSLSEGLRSGSISVPAKSFVTYALNAVGKETATNAHPKHKFLNNMQAFTMYWLPYSINVMLAKPMLKSLGNSAHSKVHP